jgi:hypothetical protein
VEFQQGLEMLGVFREGCANTPLDLRPSFGGQSLLVVMPTFSHSFIPSYNEIHVYLDFMDVSLAETFDIVLMRSWDNEAGRSIRFDAEYVMTLSVHLRTIQPQDVFRAFLASANRIFSPVTLTIHLQGNMVCTKLPPSFHRL